MCERWQSANLTVHGTTGGANYFHCNGPTHCCHTWRRRRIGVPEAPSGAGSSTAAPPSFGRTSASALLPFDGVPALGCFVGVNVAAPTRREGRVGAPPSAVGIRMQLLVASAAWRASQAAAFALGCFVGVRLSSRSAALVPMLPDPAAAVTSCRTTVGLSDPNWPLIFG